MEIGISKHTNCRSRRNKSLRFFFLFICFFFFSNLNEKKEGGGNTVWCMDVHRIPRFYSSLSNCRKTISIEERKWKKKKNQKKKTNFFFKNPLHLLKFCWGDIGNKIQTQIVSAFLLFHKRTHTHTHKKKYFIQIYLVPKIRKKYFYRKAFKNSSKTLL